MSQETSSGKPEPIIQPTEEIALPCCGTERSTLLTRGENFLLSTLRMWLLVSYRLVFLLLRSLRGKNRLIPVYDLVNAGPRHRYATANALVANCTIGMSYRMGAGKFLLSCKKMKASLDPVPPAQWSLDRRLKFILSNVEEIDWRDPANADHISAFIASDRVVQEWRQKNPKVSALWMALENQMKTAAKNGQTEYTFRLPSGRTKTYYNVAMRTVPKVVIDPDDPKKREQRFDTQLFAAVIKGNKPMAIHGGVLTEHLVQSISRDIMFQGARDIWKAYPHWTYIGNVYDEVIFEIPEGDAELANRVVPELLCNGTARAWMGDLPLAVEGGIRDKYEK